MVGTTNRFHCSINTDRVLDERLVAFAGSVARVMEEKEERRRARYGHLIDNRDEPGAIQVPKLSRQALLVSCAPKFVHLITQCEC